MKRYFKATDGNRTVFRATGSNGFAFAGFIGRRLAFANKPAVGLNPTQEITLSEYNALVARKTERLKAAGRTGASPQDSWVFSAPLMGG